MNDEKVEELLWTVVLDSEGAAEIPESAPAI
jgi:hypothetical protein